MATSLEPQPPSAQAPTSTVAVPAEFLDRLMNRLDRLEQRLDQLAAPVEQAPHVIGAVADTADGWLRQAQAQGIDIDAALKAAGPLLLTLADPKLLHAINGLAQQLPDIAKLADAGPKALAAITDTVDSWIAQLSAQGVDAQAMTENIAAALAKLGELLKSPQYAALMNSGVLDPDTVEMVGKAGSALVHARKEACIETGMFGALRATGDRDVQRAIGFAIKFANAFGQELAQPDNLKHLAATTPSPE